jgi:hypothetical protein
VSDGLTGARARRLRRCDVTEDGRSVFIANDATHLIDVVCRHFLLLTILIYDDSDDYSNKKSEV